MAFRRSLDTLKRMSQAPSQAAVEDLGSIREEIAELTRANRAERSVELERRLLQLRHLAGIALVGAPLAHRPLTPSPAFDLIDDDAPVPETTPENLTPELLRAAILKKGCLIVRGLVDPDRALAFGDGIEESLAAREAQEPTDLSEDGWFEFFQAQEPHSLEARAWVTDAGGIWAADSPRLTFEVLEMFEQAGLQHTSAGTSARTRPSRFRSARFARCRPTAGNGFPGWHQDGRFLGEVRALNVWLTLTHCGDDAPGLDLVPRRIEQIVPTGTEGAVFDWVVAPHGRRRGRGDLEIVRPHFEPGDAMLFDDLFLHSTAAEPPCPTLAMRSRAGSSGLRASRGNTPRWRSEPSPDGPRVFLLGARPGFDLARARDTEARLAETGGNTGNQLIATGLLRSFKWSDLEWDHSIEPEAIEEEFDVIVVPAANFLISTIDHEGMATFLDKVELPCVTVGLGAQSASYRARVPLKPGTERLVRILAERTEVLGVRGDFTASVLDDLGIHNHEVTGCPSFFSAATRA